MRVVTLVSYLTGALVLQDLVDAGEEVVGVVCFPEDPTRPLPSPEYSVREVAYRSFLPVYTVRPDQVNTTPFVDVIRKLKPDLIVTMHFAKVLGRRILATPPLGGINMHPSRLPEGRGMTPFVWHMALGQGQVHQTLHYLDSGIDTGPIIDMASVDVEPTDTGFTVTRKLCHASAQMLKRNLPAVKAGAAPRRPQGEVNASYCKPGYPWSQIVWGRPSVAVDRQVRAYARPMSGAFTTIGGQRLTVWSATLPTDDERDLALSASSMPGEVIAVKGDGWVVRTGDGGVVLTDAELAPAPVAAATADAPAQPRGVRVGVLSAVRLVLG